MPCPCWRKRSPRVTVRPFWSGRRTPGPRSLAASRGMASAPGQMCLSSHRSVPAANSRLHLSGRRSPERQPHVTPTSGGLGQGGWGERSPRCCAASRRSSARLRREGEARPPQRGKLRASGEEIPDSGPSSARALPARWPESVGGCGDAACHNNLPSSSSRRRAQKALGSQHVLKQRD